MCMSVYFAFERTLVYCPPPPPPPPCRGLLPFPERKQAVMDVQEKLRGSGRFSSSGGEGDVQQDSLVCLRSSPIYTAGTKAIYCKGHRLQVPHPYVLSVARCPNTTLHIMYCSSILPFFHSSFTVQFSPSLAVWCSTRARVLQLNV